MIGRPTHVLEIYGSTGWRGPMRGVCGMQLTTGSRWHPPGIAGGMNTCLRCQAVLRARRKGNWCPRRWRRVDQPAPIAYVGHRGARVEHLANGLWRWTAGELTGTVALRDYAMDAADREMLKQTLAQREET